MKRALGWGVLAATVGGTSCSNPPLGTADAGGGVDGGVSDAIADASSDVGAGGAWTPVAGEVDAPAGDSLVDAHFKSVGPRIVVVATMRATNAPQSWTFDGLAWRKVSASGLPTSVNISAGSAIGVDSTTVLLYGTLADKSLLFTYVEGSGWTAAGSGGPGWANSRMALIDGGRVLLAGGPPSGGAAWWTWSKASSWGKYDPAPKSALADGDKFILFNVGSSLFAVKAGTTYEWSADDWKESGISGGPTKPNYSGLESERWATDGKRAFVIVEGSVWIFDGDRRAWRPPIVSPCGADRRPDGVAALDRQVYQFCVPSVGSGGSLVTFRWKD